MGSAIRMTRARAARSQTGNERSRLLKMGGLEGPPKPPVTRLGAEELHEALLDFFVALLQLLGIDLEQLEVRQLGLVGRIGDARMARVEAFAVGQDLLQLARE